ncbi:MAG: NAD(P)-dependent oxidoreductase [Candidatus Saccharimonadaceae bacterium]
MRIAVIAANGRLGKEFVEAALAAGHSVQAGIRGQNTLAPNDNLTVLTCDATKSEDLRALFKNQEAVVSAIGHVKNSTPDVQTVATQAIVSIMEELTIKRFVDVTGTGVRFLGDKISLVDRALNLGVGIIDKNRVADGRSHQEVLKNSSIDWTTIRILKLQNVKSKPYKLTLNGPTKWYVGRKEVATAMLEVIEAGSFVKQAPIISKL